MQNIDVNIQKITDRVALLPLQCAASVGYYTLMQRYAHVVIDTSMPYDKRRKSTHRYDIADTHGPMRLTVPVVRPANSRGATWSDVLVSGHGDWQHVHSVAVASAYGRTPYYEFYADALEALYTTDWNGRRLVDYDVAFDTFLRSRGGVDTRVSYGLDSVDAEEVSGADDYRRADIEALTPVTEYYQVRQSAFGFLPHLSMLDLLMNMGPESVYVLTGRER